MPFNWCKQIENCFHLAECVSAVPGDLACFSLSHLRGRVKKSWSCLGLLFNLTSF